MGYSDYRTPSNVPVRHGTPCPHCKWGLGTFFARYYDGRGVFHCSSRHCGVFFLDSFPKPDFHSVKNSISSSSQGSEVSVVVTPQRTTFNDEEGSRFSDRVGLTQATLGETRALLVRVRLSPRSNESYTRNNGATTL